TPLSVSGANDGAINLTTAGGSGNYIFNWSGPNNYYASSEDIYNLSAGEYCVTVSDGCEESHGCFEIAFCGDFDIQISGVVTPTCHGFNYGIINISNVTDVRPPLKYSWSNGAKTQLINNLSPGQYCVTITDSRGCEANKCFTVGSNSSLTYTEHSTPCE